VVDCPRAKLLGLCCTFIRNGYKGFQLGFRDMEEDLLCIVWAVKGCNYAGLYYPDYALDWIARSDASELGVGVVLLQVHIDEAGKATQQQSRWPESLVCNRVVDQT
jgi:hypothetical protein